MEAFYKDNHNTIYCLDFRKNDLPDESIQCVVTSPPYWGLRRYSGEQELIWGDNHCEHQWVEHEDRAEGYTGTLRWVHGDTGRAYQKDGLSHAKNRRDNPEAWSKDIRKYGFCSLCGAWKGAYGLEPTPEMYIEHTIEILREIRRVLRRDGVVFWNIGDSYSGSGQDSGKIAGQKRSGGTGIDTRSVDIIGVGEPVTRAKHPILKPKDLCLIPFRVAIAAQEDGWWVRSVIIWCLSGGAYVYARTQKGDMPMMIRDMARLNPATVKLWNGERWTQLRGMSKSKRQGNELEIVLRSGERISCTPSHRFPTNRGLLLALELEVGDIIDTCLIPEPSNPKIPSHIGLDAAWLAGLYIAEGSKADDTIQIAGHIKEDERWQRLRKIAVDYGGYATRTIDGNKMDIRLYGKVLVALLDELVSGHTAKDKCFASVVWRYGNDFIDEMLQGYLDGDGHWDAPNERWWLGFTRNYNLERDLRTACARLRYRLTLNPSSVPYKGKRNPTFRGELRFERSGHGNEKPMSEIVAIRKARCREVYDLGIEDEPHLFSLASGVLTHNSKPNPMPESVTDRPTESHEYILMLTKSGTSQYWTHRDHEGTRTQPKPDYRWIKQIGVEPIPSKEFRYDGQATKDYASAGAQDPSETKRRILKGMERRGRQANDTDLNNRNFMPTSTGMVVEEITTKPEGWTPKNKMGWDRINLWKGHDYYWDADAVREGEGRRYTEFFRRDNTYTQGRAFDAKAPITGRGGEQYDDTTGRNIRSVWEFPTQPYPEAHFAVFPEKLPEICIKAATPEVGCCSKCGAPWERITEVPKPPEEMYTKSTLPNDGLIHTGIRRDGKFRGSGQSVQNWREENPISTLGWQPTCKCNADKVPSIVLDPFMGAGTTLWVAKKLNRKAVGYEISKEYCQLAAERNRQQALVWGNKIESDTEL